MARRILRAAALAAAGAMFLGGCVTPAEHNRTVVELTETKEDLQEATMELMAAKQMLQDDMRTISRLQQELTLTKSAAKGRLTVAESRARQAEKDADAVRGQLNKLTQRVTAAQKAAADAGKVADRYKAREQELREVVRKLTAQVKTLEDAAKLRKAKIENLEKQLQEAAAAAAS